MLAIILTSCRQQLFIPGCPLSVTLSYSGLVKNRRVEVPYDDCDPAFDQCRYTVKGQDLNHDIYIVIPDPHLHVNVKVIN